MFKNFFNRHISIVKADESVLDAVDDVINVMGLNIDSLGSYTDEELIKLGKTYFPFATTLSNDMYKALGDLYINKQKIKSNIGDRALIEYYLELFSDNVDCVPKTYALDGTMYFDGTRYRPNDIIYPEVKDEFKYNQYDLFVDLADYFVNINLNLTTISGNTILTEFSDSDILKLIQYGIKYFYKGKYVMLNIQKDALGSVTPIKNNRTYLIGKNYIKQFDLGYIKADGRILRYDTYNPLAYVLGFDNSLEVFNIPTSSDYFYVGFFTDYLKQSLVVNTINSHPTYINYLNNQRHTLKRLLVSSDAGVPNYYKGPSDLYKLEYYTNYSSRFVLTVVPSVYIKYIDIRGNALTTNDVAPFFNWYIDRNVFNTVLKIDGALLGFIDYETLITDYNWDITYYGELSGTYTVGELRVLPKNQDVYWLPCSGVYVSIYQHALLWYVIRATYASEKISNNGINLFYIPNINQTSIYRGNLTDYNNVTELNFLINSVSNIRFENITNQFNNLVSFKLRGDFNTVLINNPNLTTFQLEGKGNALSYEALTYSIDSNSLNHIIVSGGTTANPNIVVDVNTNELIDTDYENIDLPYFVLFLLNYIENLDTLTINNTLFNTVLFEINPAKPSGLNYTRITNFTLQDVLINESLSFQTEIFDKLLIDNLYLYNVSFDTGTLEIRLNRTGVSMGLLTLTVDNSFCSDIYIDNNELLTSIVITNSIIGDELKYDAVNTALNTLVITDSQVDILNINNAAALQNITLTNLSIADDVVILNHQSVTIDLSSITVNGSILDVRSSIMEDYIHCDNNNSSLVINISNNCTNADFRSKIIGGIIAVTTQLDENTLVNLNWSSLKVLDIGGSANFTSIATNNGIALEEVNIEKTNISNLDTSNSVNLTDLTINDTPINSLDIVNNVELVYLSAMNTSIDDTTITAILTALVNNNKLDGYFHCNLASGVLSTTDNALITTLTNRGWDVNVT